MIYFFKVVCVCVVLPENRNEKRIHVIHVEKMEEKDEREERDIVWWSVWECGREGLLYCGEENDWQRTFLLFECGAVCKLSVDD